MKECIKRLWDTLKTTLQIAKALQISSSKVHNIIKTGEISLPKGQGRKPLLDARGLRALRRHCFTHRHDYLIDITKWAQEYIQKSLSVNTIRHAICRCQLKLYHAKRKPYVNMVQKHRRVLWAESKFDIIVGNHGRRVLRAKEEGDLPACHQCSVQKPASLMVWGCICAYCMGNLHVLESTMNAERYIKVLEQHMLPSRRHIQYLTEVSTPLIFYYIFSCDNTEEMTLCYNVK